jgi:hypothetical protein
VSVLDEFVPVSVDFDAPQLKDSLDAFLDPPHSAMIAALSNHMLDCTFNLSRADLKIQGP